MITAGTLRKFAPLVGRGGIEQFSIFFDPEGQGIRLLGLRHHDERKATDRGGNIVAKAPGSRRIDLQVEARQPADHKGAAACALRRRADKPPTR